MRRWILGSALLLITVGFVFRAPLLEGAGRSLIDEDPPAPADAIVVLAGSVADRALEAVALYKGGYAPRIVFSRAPASLGFAQLAAMGVDLPRPSELSRSIAQQLGVPAGDIVEVGGSSPSTYTEAEVLLTFLEAQGYDSVLLVTSKTHTRRAALIFRRLSRGRCRIVSRPSRYDPFSPDSWWHDRISLQRVVFEYQKLAVFFLLDRWKSFPARRSTATIASG